MRFKQIVQVASKKIFGHNFSELGISLLTVKRLKFLPAGKPRSLKITDGVVYYHSPLELAHAFEEIFGENIYSQQLPDSPYILDCGANIGISAFYFKKQFPGATIEAFEPDEANFKLLQKNVESLKLDGVIIHQKAIWKENTSLNFSSDGSMSSRIESNAKSDGTYVTAVRLKDLLTRQVDFLKLDIEGAEYEVIKDIADDLFLVRNMFLEYHGSFSQNPELLEILEIVKKAGFVFYIKEAAVLYDQPFTKVSRAPGSWDVQLNIFCFRQ